MKFLIPLIAVAALPALAFVGVAVLGWHGLFGVIIPYIAFTVFLSGFLYRVVQWGKAPVPFRIPTTCGQQRSLPWFQHDRFENPATTSQVIVRMALEILVFRSLFRNLSATVHAGGKVTYTPAKALWAGSLLFHWCFLFVILRHFRFFFSPVPTPVSWLSKLDGFLQIGVPGLLLTGAALLASLLYLLGRRLVSPQLRYITLAGDYFPLLLLIAIATTGLTLRHFIKDDISAIKEMMMSLVTFAPHTADGAHWLFYAHLLLVSVLFAYFPFSKLMHAGGVFLSPTRNLANNNRIRRHVNPWATPAEIHSYAEYEDEFRDKMKAAGIPVDKE
jgi:nitrate reductase gamma subunit